MAKIEYKTKTLFASGASNTYMSLGRWLGEGLKVSPPPPLPPTKFLLKATLMYAPIWSFHDENVYFGLTLEVLGQGWPTFWTSRPNFKHESLSGPKKDLAVQTKTPKKDLAVQTKTTVWGKVNVYNTYFEEKSLPAIQKVMAGTPVFVDDRTVY
jgi:hypothetical protein